MDSALHFINQSDEGVHISYKWTFGDNTSSQDKNPTHVYNSPGIYKISLIAYYKTIPADTFTREVRILLGQKEFRTNHTYAQAVDIEEASEKDLIILASSFDQYGDSLNYVLIRTDSLLKEKWRQLLPAPGIRLNSIKKINANEFILAGNYSKGNTHQFALSKIDGSGNEIWTKYINNIDGQNEYVGVTSDGGFITIGNAGIGSQAYCVVVKCNSNGTEMWRKAFQNPLGYPHLSDARNIVEVSSGFVFAGIKGSIFSFEVVMTQLDPNGNIVKQNTVSVDYGGSVFGAGIAASGNAYMVNLVNTPYAYRFQSDLTPLSLLKVGETSLNSVISKNNQFFFAEGSHQYSFVTMTNDDGEQQWRSIIDHKSILSCTSVHYGSNRYCKKVLYSTSGDVVALSEGQNDYNSFDGSSVYIERFSLDGLVR
jgi:hypothetical protein